jgi:streptogramin lyase
VVIALPAQFGFAQPGDGAIWGSLEHRGARREIVRIDPATYEVDPVVRDLPIRPGPVAPVVVNGSIWLPDDIAGSVTQYSAETGKRIRKIEVGPFPIEPVAAFGDVWTINHHGDSITRINSDTGEATSIELPGSRPLTITVVADDLMLVNGPESNPTTTWMVEPERMQMIGTFESPGCFKQYGWIGTAIEGQVWRRYCGKEEVTIADPRTGEILETFESPACPYPPLHLDGSMWLPSGPEPCSDRTRGLVALLPETREVVARYELPAEIRVGGWWFAAFDSWWYYNTDSLVRVPSDTLREATAR